jgi:hypothetical protein
LNTTQRSPFAITNNRIGVVFLAVGVLSLGFSVFAGSQILALIGLGLAFWGALFFFITPARYVDRSLLESTAVSSYTTIDRIISEQKITGKGYYIPPYPKDVFLPEHLSGLKDSIVFVSKEDTVEMPAIDEIAESKFEGIKTKGIFISAPGAALLDQLEKKSKVDLSKVNKEELFESLPNLIINHLSLANEIILNQKDEEIRLTLRDSAYQNLYSRELGIKSISILGCPIASAVACAVAKNTGKRVVLQNLKTGVETRTTMITFRVVQG